MKDWFTVLVPTIYDETVEFDQEKLRRLADESGVDALTLKNAFIGKGIAFLLKTPDYSKVEKLTAALKSFKIPCLPAYSEDVHNEIKVVHVKRLVPGLNGVNAISSDNESFFIKGKIILVSDVLSQEVATVKKAVISAKKLTLISGAKVFVIDLSVTRVLTLDGKKGISQKGNLITILEEFRKKGNLILDSSYYFESGFFRKDIVELSVFIAYGFEKGFYEKKLPNFLFKKAKPKQKPVFNHKVIRSPLKMMFYKYNLKLKNNVVYPPIFWLGFIFILLYIGIRARESMFFIVAFLIAFIICLLKLFSVWKIKHLIEDTPTSKLRSVAAGFVEVTGRVTSPVPIISPISGSPCVFFRYFKEVYIRAGRYSHWSLAEIGEGYAEHCILKDETGEIGVNVKNASFFLTNKYVTDSTFLDIRFSLFGSDNVRYIEEYILDGQTVYVLGTAKPVSKSISYGKFLSEVKKDKEKMKNFDLNNDGVIDFEEWQKAQGKLRNEFLEYKQLKGQGADLVIDKDSNNKVLIVSNEKETGLLKRLKIALPLYFFGSLFFLVLTLWLTVKFF